MTTQNSTSIIVKDFNGVKVHTFLAPYEAAANATHIIETENKLVLVDTHFLTPLAQAFKGYALSLNKPIDRIFISHGHPDHYFGLASAFSEYPAYTLTGIDKVIAEWGPQMIKNQKPMFGDLIPNEVVVPQHTLTPNTEEVIDGLTYQYEMVEGAESEAQLLIKLPQIGVIVAQDLVYSGVHLWLGMGWFDKWISELENVLNADGYNYILSGHGLPCGKDEVMNCIYYLKVAKELFAKKPSAEEFKSQLLTKYPYRESPMMFDMYLGFLFGQMSSH